MRKDKKFALFSLAAIVILFAGLTGHFMFAARQPMYEGKYLGIWLKNYDNPQDRYTGDWQKTDECVRSLGSNAIPTLLQMLSAKDYDLELKAIKLCQRQRFVKISHTYAHTLNIEAARAFEALGADGAVAVPDLVKIFERNISQLSINRTAASLGYIGSAASNAVPALLRGATNTNEIVRFAAVSALKEIRSRPDLVVPALIRALRSPDPGVSGNAAYLLGIYGAQAKDALPVLAELSQGEDFNMSFYASYAIKQIKEASVQETLADGNRAQP